MKSRVENTIPEGTVSFVCVMVAMPTVFSQSLIFLVPRSQDASDHAIPVENQLHSASRQLDKANKNTPTLCDTYDDGLVAWSHDTQQSLTMLPSTGLVDELVT
jgi:hypothetical protein